MRLLNSSRVPGGAAYVGLLRRLGFPFCCIRLSCVFLMLGIFLRIMPLGLNAHFPVAGPVFRTPPILGSRIEASTAFIGEPYICFCFERAIYITPAHAFAIEKKTLSACWLKVFWRPKNLECPCWKWGIRDIIGAQRGKCTEVL